MILHLWKLLLFLACSIKSRLLLFEWGPGREKPPPGLVYGQPHRGWRNTSSLVVRYLNNQPLKISLYISRHSFGVGLCIVVERSNCHVFICKVGPIAPSSSYLLSFQVSMYVPISTQTITPRLADKERLQSPSSTRDSRLANNPASVNGIEPMPTMWPRWATHGPLLTHSLRKH